MWTSSVEAPQPLVGNQRKPWSKWAEEEEVPPFRQGKQIAGRADGRTEMALVGLCSGSGAAAAGLRDCDRAGRGEGRCCLRASLSLSFPQGKQSERGPFEMAAVSWSGDLIEKDKVSKRLPRVSLPQFHSSSDQYCQLRPWREHRVRPENHRRNGFQFHWGLGHGL